MYRMKYTLVNIYPMEYTQVIQSDGVLTNNFSDYCTLVIIYQMDYTLVSTSDGVFTNQYVID